MQGIQNRTWWAEQTDMIRDTIRWCQERVGMQDVRITWAWNDRFTSRMGDAKTNIFQRSGHVRFSRPLWPRAVEEKPRNTVIHEVAHVLANIEAGRNVGHGRPWKLMMIRLGENPKRCYSADEVNREGLRRRQARYQITCPGCRQPITFGPTVRRKWLAGQTRICKRCRTRIGPDVVRGAKLAG